MTKKQHLDTPMEPVPIYTVGSNGLATASLVLGIIGLVLTFVPLLTTLGLILGILAVTLGAVGLAQSKRRHAGRGVAIAGLGLGLAATTAAVAILAETARLLDQL